MRTNDADTIRPLRSAVPSQNPRSDAGLRAIVLGERPAQDRITSAVDLSSATLGRHREFGIRSYPWNRPVSRLRRKLEKRIANDDACVIPGNMGKLQRPGVMPKDTCSWSAVAHRPLCLAVNTRYPPHQIEAFQIGSAPGSHQYVQPVSFPPSSSSISTTLPSDTDTLTLISSLTVMPSRCSCRRKTSTASGRPSQEYRKSQGL